MERHHEIPDDHRYEFEEYYFYEEILDDQSTANICHEFEYSLLFFVVVAVIGLSFGIYAIVLMSKRRNLILYGFDILYSLLFISASIRFAVKLWQAASVHGQQSIATQSGCKLIAYTVTGMAHVISYILLALVIYAYLGLKSADFTKLDAAIKRHLGWLILGLFALEGIFGLVPAIFMDVGTTGKSCNSTQTLHMSVDSYVAAHLLLQSILPYLLPFTLMAYPLYTLVRQLKGISDAFYRSIVRNVIVLAVSYIVAYLPLAILSLIIFPTILHGGHVDFFALCVAEGVMRFFEDVWFIMAVFMVVLGDPELGHDFPGKAKAIEMLKKLRRSSTSEMNVTSVHYENQEAEI